MVEFKLIVLVVFRLVNFGVMLGIGYYLFNKYLRPGLVAQMNAEKKEMDTLERQYRQLALDQRNLDTMINNELIEQQTLREKVMRWHDALALKKERLAYEYAERKQGLEMLYQQQLVSIQKEHLAKEILPLVIDHARHTLEQQFAPSQQQAAYFDHVTGVMKKMERS